MGGIQSWELQSGVPFSKLRHRQREQSVLSQAEPSEELCLDGAGTVKTRSKSWRVRGRAWGGVSPFLPGSPGNRDTKFPSRKACIWLF